VAQKAFVTAWKKCRVDYFYRVIEAEAACPRLSGAQNRPLRPIQKWTSTHGSIDAKAKKVDQCPCEGTILP
jgi:hypothetical protein